MLQSYGTGWQSANFLAQERQLFGAPGGVWHDWDLKTNIDGIYAAGDCIGGPYQINKAAGEGQKAALNAVEDYLHEKEK